MENTNTKKDIELKIESLIKKSQKISKNMFNETSSKVYNRNIEKLQEIDKELNRLRRIKF